MPPDPRWDPGYEWMVVFWDSRTSAWLPMGPPHLSADKATKELDARRAANPDKHWRLVILTTTYSNTDR